jgi:ribonuclease Z
MNKITCTLLGTGNATPTKERNHSAILIEYEGETILIDCGEGTQRQFRKAEINPCRLTKILITHLHGDHILGLPGLLETLSMSSYSKTLEIYGPRGTHRHISTLEQLYGKFRLSLRVHEVENQTVSETKEFSIETRSMQHGIPTNAYSFILKDKIRLDKKKITKLKLPNNPLLGELQRGKDITYKGKKIKASTVTYKEEGKKITIILDTGFNTEAINLAKESDLVICEATYSHEDEQTAQEYKHLTATQAATIAKKSKSESLLLTHISQRYENTLSLLEKQAKKIFKNTRIAKDLDVLEI